MQIENLTHPVKRINDSAALTEELKNSMGLPKSKSGSGKKRESVVKILVFFVLYAVAYMFFLGTWRRPSGRNFAIPTDTSLGKKKATQIGDDRIKKEEKKREIVKIPSSIVVSSATVEELLDSEIISMCHTHWRGIKAATYGYGFPVLEITGYEDESSRTHFVNFLKHCKRLQKLVINGVPPGTIELSRDIHNAIPSIQVYFTYHGSTPQHSVIPVESKVTGELVKAYSHQWVYKIGLLKTGFASFFEKTLGVRAMTIPNYPPKKVNYYPKYSLLDGKKHIGVFAENSWMKDIITQISAACMIPNHAIHVLADLSNYEYLSHCNIIKHEMMNHAKFMQILGKMDLNSYATLSECYPMTVLESLSQGVPCLTGTTSTIFESDPLLSKNLVVQTTSSIENLNKHMETALENSEEIIKRIPPLLSYLDDNAKKEWAEFLEVPKSKVEEAVNEKEHVIQGNKQTVKVPNQKYIKLKPEQPPKFIENSNSKTIVFVTHEFGAISPSGLGNVLSATLEELLQHEIYKIIVVYDFEENSRALLKWKEKVGAKKHLHVENLKFYHLNSLLPPHLQNKRDYSFLIANSDEKSTIAPNSHNSAHNPIEFYKNNVFLQKAMLFNEALVNLYKDNPFSVVEFHEHAGPAYIALKNQLELKPPFLPKYVRILERIHGSFELVDLADENVPVDEQRIKMYEMERFGLANSLLLFPSEKIRAFYETAYNMKFYNSIILNPPLKTLLIEFSEQKKNEENEEKSPQTTTDAQALNYDMVKSSNIIHFGKLQSVKGVFLLLKAAIQLFSENPNLPGKIYFVGPDTVDQKTGKSTAAALKALIPKKLENRFRFINKMLTKNQKISVFNDIKPRAAVIASKFSTFNLVAHELYHLGIPLVVPDFAAFQKYFNSDNSITFKRWDTNSLKNALQKVLQDDFEIMRLKTAPPLNYDETSLIYHQLL